MDTFNRWSWMISMKRKKIVSGKTGTWGLHSHSDRNSQNTTECATLPTRFTSITFDLETKSNPPMKACHFIKFDKIQSFMVEWNVWFVPLSSTKYLFMFFYKQIPVHVFFYCMSVMIYSHFIFYFIFLYIFFYIFYHITNLISLIFLFYLLIC